MDLSLDPASAIPLSEQLRAALERAIARGRLLPGDRLPTVRELAEREGLAPNTVAKAYRALERDGWIVGRGRLGTFVTDALPGKGSRGDEALSSAARAYVRRARQLGVDQDATVAAIRRALEG